MAVLLAVKKTYPLYIQAFGIRSAQKARPLIDNCYTVKNYDALAHFVRMLFLVHLNIPVAPYTLLLVPIRGVYNIDSIKKGRVEIVELFLDERAWFKIPDSNRIKAVA